MYALEDYTVARHVMVRAVRMNLENTGPVSVQTSWPFGNRAEDRQCRFGGSSLPPSC